MTVSTYVGIVGREIARIFGAKSRVPKGMTMEGKSRDLKKRKAKRQKNSTG